MIRNGTIRYDSAYSTHVSTSSPWNLKIKSPKINRGTLIKTFLNPPKIKETNENNERILQVENGSFTLLVFSVNGGMGKVANKCYSRIAEKLAEKRDEPYSVMMSWIRRKISFLMVKSVIMCIRGSWSIKHEREKHNVEELASYSEAQYNVTWLTKKKLWTI